MAENVLGEALVRLRMIKGNIEAQAVAATRGAVVAAEKHAKVNLTFNRNAAIGAAVGLGRAAGGSFGGTFGKAAGASLVGGGFGLTSGAATAGVGLFLRSAFQSAVDLQEQMTAVTYIFGQATDEIVTFSETSAERLGISQRAALKASADFGNFFTSLGVGRDAAAQLSIPLTKLAADLASFRNIATTDALEKLKSGLVGLPKPLRTVGIFISEDAVNAEAAALGFQKFGRELTDAQKVLARYAVAIEQSKNAQGDFPRTIDNTANRLRVAAAEFDQFKVAVGRTAQSFVDLVLVATPVLSVLERIANGVRKGTEAVSNTLRQQNTAGEENVAILKEVGASLVALPIAPTVGVLGLLHSAYRTVNNLLDDHKSKTDAVTSSTSAATKAQEEYAEALQQIRRVEAGLIPNSEQLDALRKSEARTRQTGLNAFQQYIGAEQSLRSAQNSVADAGQRVGEAQERVNKLRRQGAVDAKEVASAERGVVTAQRQVVDAQQKIIDLEGRLAELRRRSIDDEFRRLELRLQSARLDSLEATQDLADAERKFNLVRRSRNTPLARSLEIEYQRALIASEGATLDIKDAEADVQTAREDGTQTQRDLIQGEKDLQRSREDLTQAVEDEAAAEQKLREARAGDPDFARNLAAAQRDVASAVADQRRAQEGLPAAVIAVRLAEEGLREVLRDNGALYGGLVDFLEKLQRDSPQYAAALQPLIDQLRAFNDELERAARSQERTRADKVSAMERYRPLIDAYGIDWVRRNVPNSGLQMGGTVEPNRSYAVGEGRRPEQFTSTEHGVVKPEHGGPGYGAATYSGGGPMVAVYPRAGQSEAEIGHIAAREMAWRMKASGRP